MGVTDATGDPAARGRARLEALVRRIEPLDALEKAHLREAVEWARSGAPLHRVRKPDVPATHLVSYFVVVDEARGELLLAAHRKAGLWLPSGGHVEPGEGPWDTVLRECPEELHIPATPSRLAGDRPIFLTVTRTRPPGVHTDVSLWYVLSADVDAVTSYDTGEFAAIRWLSAGDVLNEPIDTLDPHMHRFVRKLLARLGGEDADGAGDGDGEAGEEEQEADAEHGEGLAAQ